MKVSLSFRFTFHILLMLLIEFAVGITYKNSTILGKSVTHQLVNGIESKRTQTIVFYGCFSVWKGQNSRLEPPGSYSQFDELNNPASCTEKCQLMVTFKIVVT